MKNTIFILVFTALLLAGTGETKAFSTENHATVAYIAEQHMSKKALTHFKKAFGNHSLVEFASYPDFYRAIYIVDGHKISHSVELDENLYPKAGPEDKGIGAYDGLIRSIDQLRDYMSLDDSTRYVAVGLLIHFLGDTHCPSHLKYADKRGKIKSIRYKMYLYKEKDKPRKVDYHGFWDSWASDLRYPHGFIERAMMFDTVADKREIGRIQEGSIEDWIHASAVACGNAYDVEEGQLVDRVYVIRKAGLVATQIRDAGYRLAAIMNELFAK